MMIKVDWLWQKNIVYLEGEEFSLINQLIDLIERWAKQEKKVQLKKTQKKHCVTQLKKLKKIHR